MQPVLSCPVKPVQSLAASLVILPIPDLLTSFCPFPPPSLSLSLASTSPPPSPASLSLPPLEALLLQLLQKRPSFISAAGSLHHRRIGAYQACAFWLFGIFTTHFLSCLASCLDPRRPFSRPRSTRRPRRSSAGSSPSRLAKETPNCLRNDRPNLDPTSPHRIDTGATRAVPGTRQLEVTQVPAPRAEGSKSVCHQPWICTAPSGGFLAPGTTARPAKMRESCCSTC